MTVRTGKHHIMNPNPSFRGIVMLFRKGYVVNFCVVIEKMAWNFVSFARISEGTRWRCRMCNGFSRAGTHNAVARQEIF